MDAHAKNEVLIIAADPKYPIGFRRDRRKAIFLFVRSSVRECVLLDLTDKPTAPSVVAFSNRPFGVKRFQTIHHFNVDVAHGLALLFGLGTTALPLWDSRTRRNNLLGGLTVKRTAGPSAAVANPCAALTAAGFLQAGDL
jgi:hypothetical protein